VTALPNPGTIQTSSINFKLEKNWPKNSGINPAKTVRLSG
jgi:hypothetical protein